MIGKLSLATALAVVAGLLAADGATGETRVSGAVRGIWRANDGPFIVEGHITLGANDNLVIEPGITVRFDGNYRFTIYGWITAVGTERDSIRFIGSGQPSSWLGLNVSRGSADRGQFKFCVVQDAYQGFSLDDADPLIENSRISFCGNAGVHFSRSLGRLLNCSISNISGHGVVITDQSRATVRDNNILACSDNGIAIGDNASPIVSYNLIEEVSDHGISLASAGVSTITWNTILRPGLRGISVAESNGQVIKRNVIYLSGGPGVIIYRSTNISLINNTILASGLHGLQISSNSSGGIINNIIGESSGYGITSSLSAGTYDYNDLYSNGEGDYDGVEPGRNDLHVSPSLVSPGEGDFHPHRDSPMVDAGDGGQDRDPDGTRAEIGAWFYNQNHPPEIRAWSPDTLIEVTGDDTVDFAIEAVDSDGHILHYLWSVNGIREWQQPNYRRVFNRDGEYVVRVVVDDRYYLGTAEHVWQFTVRGSFVAPEPGLPDGFALSEVYPNPFNSTLRLSLTLPRPGAVRLDLCNIAGRRVAGLYQGELATGNHSRTFEAADLPAGEYIIVADLGAGRVVRRVVLLK